MRLFAIAVIARHTETGQIETVIYNQSARDIESLAGAVYADAGERWPSPAWAVMANAVRHSMPEETAITTRVIPFVPEVLT